MIRRLLPNLLLAALAVALTLAVGEFASRALFPEWVPEAAERTFWRYDERLGWANDEGRSGVHRQPDFEVRVEISEQGLRDRVYPEARREGVPRLLVLGDSFAWGFGVERDEIFHERIEARRGWEIVNTGVAGWGTGQQLLYLEERGLAFEPDAVLLLLHANDFLDNNEPFRYGYFKPQYELDGDALSLGQVPVPRLDWEQRFDRWLRFHTYLLYRVYHAPEFLAAWREARREAAERPPAPAPKPEPRAADAGEKKKKKKNENKKDRKKQADRIAKQRARDAAAPPARKSKYDVDLALTLRLLRELRDLCAREGIGLAVAHVPMPDPPRSRFAAGVAELGIPHLDLEEALLRSEVPTRFEHDPHWTPAGHALVADAVEAFVVGAGILPAQR